MSSRPRPLLARMLPQSLRFQLLARSLLVLAVLLVLIGGVQYWYMRYFLYQNKALAMRSQAMSIPHDLMIDHDDHPRNGPPPRSRLFIPDLSVAVIAPDGSYDVISQSPDNRPVPILSNDAMMKLIHGGAADYTIRRDRAGTEQLIIVQPLRVHGTVLGFLQVSTPTKPLKDLMLKQLLTFLILASVSLLLGLLLFLPVLKRSLDPLNKMVATVEQIDAGNLAVRLPERQRQLELDRLSVSFNKMLTRLEEAFTAEKEAKEQMRRFAADASHELRTPLTSIHGFLEVLQRGAARQPDQLQKALASMYSESERLNKLVRDLLLLARLDRTPVFEAKEGNLEDVLVQMEPQLQLLGEGRTVLIRTEEGMRCRFDTDKIKQVILNLFHNAVQHTDPQNGRISVELSASADDILLRVKDNGPGIEQNHLPHVFDRFYRIDTSRARKHGGAGLGLAITKSIVEHHGGTIDVYSEEGRGCEFVVSIPRA